MTEYHIKPLGRTCAATGAPLQPGAVCYSVITERHGQLERLDYSEQGWHGPPDHTVAQWKTIVPHPPAAKKKPLDPDALLAFFEQLTENGNPADDPLRYIVAILLLRKRRFKLDGSRPDGDGEVLLYSSTQGAGSYEVRDLQLSADAMHQLQDQLTARLAAEWSPA